MSILLEIAVDTLHDAAAAQYGGADRIELCSALEEDGLSPSAELVRAVRAAVTIPIHAMVRPRAGDFCYSDEEFSAMRAGVEMFKSMGVNGIVLGILNRDRMIDAERSTELVRLAQPLPVTFHRAFDAAMDPFGSLEKVIATGATRLLTSGQKPTAPEGIELIGQLIAAARGRITIMPGAGINKSTIEAFTSMNGIEEVHVGKGVKRKNSSGNLFVDQELVRD
ncbi:MAG: copper homeostasis protein CutC, partial [Bacteroidetes bacterium]|nr:copper homeostasis protein CutC [Bacteroidota bacterium]